MCCRIECDLHTSHSPAGKLGSEAKEVKVESERERQRAGRSQRSKTEKSVFTIFFALLTLAPFKDMYVTAASGGHLCVRQALGALLPLVTEEGEREEKEKGFI